MRSHANHFLVRIDKASQKQKMNAIGSILLHPSFVHMKRFMQHGTITKIGAVAKQELEFAEIGDTLLFHHFVEAGPEQLVQVLDDGDEIRFVSGDNRNNDFQTFGVVKPDGTLIPSKYYFFLDTAIKLWETGKVTSMLQMVENPEQWDAEDRDLAMLDELDLQAKSLAMTYGHLVDIERPLTEQEMRSLEPIEKAIDDIKKERGAITRRMSAPKMAAATVLHIHPDNEKKYRVGEGGHVLVDSKMLYPFDVDGNPFFLLRKNLVQGIVDEE